MSLNVGTRIGSFEVTAMMGSGLLQESVSAIPSKVEKEFP